MPSNPTDPDSEFSGRLSAIRATTPTAAVASELLSYLTAGDLAPGARLPSERKLAETLGTGRSAVREALAALEILGVVEVRPGSGTYLRSGSSELLPRTLSWGLMLGTRNTADLTEIRTSLEVLAARLAALNAGPDDVRRLRGHLATMRENADLGDRDAFVEADARFHQELAAASQNIALANVLQSVRALLRVWVDRGVAKEEDARIAIEEHARVLDALEGNDAVKANEAMVAHMDTAATRVLSSVAEFDGEKIQTTP
ncbi:FadR/GntR family transcriptional regulator [Nocardiopsis sp. MG754419]|uniref:FadR/GntR family transcriptional regulator n=1 Tax=Nocardiopsis sp. MG754419 TaxID=2259865 RepID=UPI001BAA69EA|nr:FadR/GntR family transcriptional regulator [Nocardiopsis sp. MG754419]MBR8745204.1 GntR family transcriptional regulator [Nocardiopsis sp. MG754419]